MDNLDLEKYAIKYLDNGGKYEDIPSKNTRIKKAIEKELKRQYMVYIRYEMKRNKNFSQQILKLIKKNKDILDNPNELYKELDKLGYEKLKNLHKNILQDSKKKK
jgi:hypothetical protein